MKLKEIENHLASLEGEDLLKYIGIYGEDERVGVQKLCNRFYKRYEKEQQMIQEWHSKLAFDAFFHEETKVLVGVDEVGRGPLAGPVVAAAVILPQHCTLLGVKDSKKLSEEKREQLFEQIVQQALAIGVGIVDSQTIDEINILQATFRAMREAISQINEPIDIVCVDGDKTIPQLECMQHAIIKGDDKSASIAAASIIAKVTRDRMMKNYSEAYPYYDWESNKGYGSAKHYQGIRIHGITPLHRKSFLKKEGF